MQYDLSEASSYLGNEDLSALNDPFVRDELERALDFEIEKAELMGYDLDDPEMMGSFLKNIINKIKARIKKRKAKGGQISVTTDRGTATIGPGGIDYTSASSSSMLPSSTTGSMSELVKNPVVIAAAAGVVLLLMMKKKRGR